MFPVTEVVTPETAAVPYHIKIIRVDLGPDGVSDGGSGPNETCLHRVGVQAKDIPIGKLPGEGEQRVVRVEMSIIAGTRADRKAAVWQP